ncbi:hypothetical protein ACLB2K_000917 [Fragaria x ananassa]
MAIVGPRKQKKTLLTTLPTELFEDIVKRLNSTKSDVSRFRAVCRSWRSSIPPVDSKLQNFKIKTWKENNYKILHVNEVAVYHHLVSPAINPGEQVPRDWLVKLCSPDQGGQVMNLLDFQGFELAKAYELSGVQRFVMSTNFDSPDAMLIHRGELYHGGLGLDNKGYVNLFKFEDNQLFMRCSSYEDVIFYRGMFYAVTPDGRAIAVDGKLTKVAVSHPICIKYQYHCNKHRVLSLVESSGDLLLVERFSRKGWCDGNPLKIDVKFKVYKLNAVEEKWVEMQASDLSDRILVFLTGVHDYYGFSLAAKDFPGCQGNCIYFSTKKLPQVGVFDLSNGTLFDLESLPQSARIFLPRCNNVSIESIMLDGEISKPRLRNRLSVELKKLRYLHSCLFKKHRKYIVNQSW